MFTPEGPDRLKLFRKFLPKSLIDRAQGQGIDLEFINFFELVTWLTITNKMYDAETLSGKDDKRELKL